MKSLPIGIQTFRSFVEGNYIYVDKTKYLYNLIQSYQGIYFLSRPRRFGKSLLLSTLEEIFLGNKELFENLWIHSSDYNWKPHPVIRLDFSKQKAETPEQLKTFLIDELNLIAQKYNITLMRTDEYDKPIIDWLEEPELAAKMRSVLKGFFSILKGNDAHIRFLLLTGVSKFSKAGVFSDLNHLKDITMHNEYSSMLGITEDELKFCFKEHILDFANKKNISTESLLEKIRFWYNGYNFSSQGISVYNPFSTLLLFDCKEFKNHWFETGTPTFLIKLMLNKKYDILEIPAEVDELQFSSYEIETMKVLPLLFQTGYLTIKKCNLERMIYTLDYPNFEVKRAFLTFFTESFAERELSETMLYRLIDNLRENKIDESISVLRSFFAGVKYDIQIAQEKYYQTIFYVIFTLLGLKIETEVQTNLGRLDAVIDDKSIFIFEFKFLDSASKDNTIIPQLSFAQQALDQIKSKRYYEKYLHNGKEIYLIGVAFAERNIGEYLIEKFTVIG
jgi:Predicted AAA-ATPase/PD-(D/E)XK nuclease superfamily